MRKIIEGRSAPAPRAIATTFPRGAHAQATNPALDPDPLAALSAAAPSFAQGRPDPAVTIAAQKTAMAQLKFMDGIWRGPAWTVLQSGVRHDVTQTERIGPLLDGSMKAIEGRSYNADVTTGFNALGIVSYDPKSKMFNLHSYAQGMSGDFALVPAKGSYVWEIAAGP